MAEEEGAAPLPALGEGSSEQDCAASDSFLGEGEAAMEAAFAAAEDGGPWDIFLGDAICSDAVSRERTRGEWGSRGAGAGASAPEKVSKDSLRGEMGGEWWALRGVPRLGASRESCGEEGREMWCTRPERLRRMRGLEDGAEGACEGERAAAVAWERAGAAERARSEAGGASTEEGMAGSLAEVSGEGDACSVSLTMDDTLPVSLIIDDTFSASLAIDGALSGADNAASTTSSGLAPAEAEGMESWRWAAAGRAGSWTGLAVRLCGGLREVEELKNSEGSTNWVWPFCLLRRARVDFLMMFCISSVFSPAWCSTLSRHTSISSMSWRSSCVSVVIFCSAEESDEERAEAGESGEEEEEEEEEEGSGARREGEGGASEGVMMDLRCLPRMATEREWEARLGELKVADSASLWTAEACLA